MLAHPSGTQAQGLGPTILLVTPENSLIYSKIIIKIIFFHIKRHFWGPRNSIVVEETHKGRRSRGSWKKNVALCVPGLGVLAQVLCLRGGANQLLPVFVHTLYLATCKLQKQLRSCDRDQIQSWEQLLSALCRKKLASFMSISWVNPCPQGWEFYLIYLFIFLQGCTFGIRRFPG